MNFQRIKYLEWIKENLRNVQNDLATASVTPCSIEDLSFDPSDLQLEGPNLYGFEQLVEQIAQTYDVSPDSIVVTHGASMGIFLALSALLEAGSEVVLEVPNYEPFYRISKAIGARVKILERSFENRYQLSLEQLERKISSRTDVIIMTNLHNPSGVATNPEKLKTIGQIARENGARLLCGEAYLESVFDHPLPPAYDIAEQAISIGSLSKAYGLGGLRVGWIFCDEDLKNEIHSIENYVSPRNSYPAQQIAAEALKERGKILERGKQLVRKNVEILESWVEGREAIDWVKPDGGPICFFRVSKKIDVWELVKTLKEDYSTLVVPGDFFWAKGFIRIGFGKSSDQLRAGLTHLGEALDDLQTRKGFYT